MLVNFKTEKIDLYCEVHKKHYKGFYLKALDLKQKCPHCDLKQKQDLEKQKQDLEKQKQDLEKQNYIIHNSGLNDRYISAKADYDYPNFKKFSKYLFNLNNNLFIYGDTGVGKTLFVSELIKNNTNKYPYYINANDLIFDFNVKEFLNIVKYKKMVVIDECQKLVLDKKILHLEALIDVAYNTQALIVLSGNFNDKGLQAFKSNEYKAIVSRLKANNLQFLHFEGKDLR